VRHDLCPQWVWFADADRLTVLALFLFHTVDASLMLLL
jgi:hypothetical protein